MIIDEDTYLEHFGIKGMRWGVRNESKEARKERKTKKYEAKAKKYDVRAKMFQTKISDIDVKLAKSNWLNRRGLTRVRKELSEGKQRAETDAERKRQGKLSIGQRKVVIGAGVAAGILAAYGAANVATSGEFHRKVMQGKAFMKKNTGMNPNWEFDPNSGGVPKFKVNPALSNMNLDEDSIMSNVVSKINPDYGAPGTKVNCRRATFAYEMRRRGYDVAATKTNTGRGQTPIGLYNATNPEKDIARVGVSSLITRLKTEEYKKKIGLSDETPFKDVVEKASWGKNKIDPRPNEAIHEALFRQLSQQPDRARGEVGVQWGIGGGHSIAYEMFKGKPVLFDTQSGKKISDVKEFTDLYGELGLADAGFTRLDNVDINQDFLRRWVTNA